MSQDLWTSIDTYLATHLLPTDPALEEALRANSAADLPSIDVSPLQGRLLTLLARMQRPTNILEIGTLGGYSTICLARALPADGKLISLELNPHHAATAAENIRRAGLSSLVEIRIGPALESLAQLERESTTPFDLIFIDADKPGYPVYLDHAIQLARPGTAILCDNVIREGTILDASSSDPIAIGTRTFLEKLGAHPRLEATAIQTVGVKGHDGFALAIVKP